MGSDEFPHPRSFSHSLGFRSSTRLVDALAPYADKEFDQGEVDIHALPVGHGQSTVVRTADRTLLYDGGPSLRTSTKPTGPYDGKAPLHALRGLGVDRLDHVVLSHFHTDHFGGLEPVLREFSEDPDKELGGFHVTNTALQLANQNSSQTIRKFLKLVGETVGESRLMRRVGSAHDGGVDIVMGTDSRAQRTINLLDDDVTATFLTPHEDIDMASLNDDMASAILHVSSASTENDAILTGDAFGRPEKKAVDKVGHLLTDGLEVADVGKHCSRKVDSSDGILARLDPTVALLSHGYDESHPHAGGLAAVEGWTDADVYATGMHGVVSISMGPDGVKVDHSFAQDVEPSGFRLAEMLPSVNEADFLDQYSAKEKPVDRQVVDEARSAIEGVLDDHNLPTEDPGLDLAPAGVDAELTSDVALRVAEEKGLDPGDVAAHFARRIDCDESGYLDEVGVDDEQGVFLNFEVSEPYKETIVELRRRESVREAGGERRSSDESPID